MPNFETYVFSPFLPLLTMVTTKMAGIVRLLHKVKHISYEHLMKSYEDDTYEIVVSYESYEHQWYILWTSEVDQSWLAKRHFHRSCLRKVLPMDLGSTRESQGLGKTPSLEQPCSAEVLPIATEIRRESSQDLTGWFLQGFLGFVSYNPRLQEPKVLFDRQMNCKRWRVEDIQCVASGVGHPDWKSRHALPRVLHGRCVNLEIQQPVSFSASRIAIEHSEKLLLWSTIMKADNYQVVPHRAVAEVSKIGNL